MDSEQRFCVYKMVNKDLQKTDDKVHNVFVSVRPTFHNFLRYVKKYNPFLAWWLFHNLRIFRNRDFLMVCYLDGDQVVHRTCVFPPFYKFPFMNRNDIQVGDIWTKDQFRNKGMATGAMKYLLNMEEFRNRTVWYITDVENKQSLKLAEKSGFGVCSMAKKRNRMGVSFLGKYELTSDDSSVISTCNLNSRTKTDKEIVL